MDVVLELGKEVAEILDVRESPKDNKSYEKYPII